MKFQVTIAYVAYATYEVEAPNKDDAAVLALEQAKDEHDGDDFEAISVVRI